ncbi:hypothetical protein A4H97_32000 [Niastella yeongjuensis]|uniref:Methylamine utilisation protein MauE domain-containing protein n=1 Tax=Niastella yeongjuensis TaxID=354355 RepID=A0A1V9EIA4_9BACT|nr:MauE/DoxX family redox-associated membrane protein [Niastella yeongjuensis]OQP45867.1 hypothetical protein A4H97_32000 [Niastella yeongjuensis]SEP46701.1 Methylamine utilisation protein MauE [Niastella yeongjuensis]
MTKRTTVIEIITVLNIILFLYTGIAKIMDYSVFKEQLAMSPILSWAATPVAVLLPVVEFAIVLMLVIPRWRLKGLYASFVIMALFTAYIIAMFIVAPEMPCSCGGIISELSWTGHVVLNSVFVLLNGLAIYLQRKEKKELGKGWNSVSGYNVSHS